MSDLTRFKENGNLKPGANQAIKELKNDNVKCLFIAEDSDYFVIRKPIKLAMQNNIPIKYIESKEKLGSICSIDVNAAIAVLLKK